MRHRPALGRARGSRARPRVGGRCVGSDGGTGQGERRQREGRARGGAALQGGLVRRGRDADGHPPDRQAASLRASGSRPRTRRPAGHRHRGPRHLRRGLVRAVLPVRARDRARALPELAGPRARARGRGIPPSARRASFANTERPHAPTHSTSSGRARSPPSTSSAPRSTTPAWPRPKPSFPIASSTTSTGCSQSACVEALRLQARVDRARPDPARDDAARQRGRRTGFEPDRADRLDRQARRGQHRPVLEADDRPGLQERPLVLGQGSRRLAAPGSSSRDVTRSRRAREAERPGATDLAAQMDALGPASLGRRGRLSRSRVLARPGRGGARRGDRGGHGSRVRRRDDGRVARADRVRPRARCPGALRRLRRRDPGNAAARLDLGRPARGDRGALRVSGGASPASSS